MPRTGSWHALLAMNVILLVALAWTGTRSQPMAPVTDVVRARQIELVNERGEMRAELSLAEDGGGQLRLRSGRGEIRVKFGAGEDGAILLMTDHTTEPSVRLAAERAGPSLRLTTAGKPDRIVSP
ncbi:MAG TPA: hypothetical protein VJR58_04255 [Vineibacter sp.]|nr:hypothetical protein [Vineibacter sp.]